MLARIRLIIFGGTSSASGSQSGSVGAPGGFILREDGSFLLREDGSKLLREFVDSFVLREDGSYLLREDGFRLARETF